MDWRKVERAAREQGFRLEATKKGTMFYPPDPTKQPVLVHGTPSDHRAQMNNLARLRRSGLVWPPPKKGRK